jgi:hypothetical protein
MIVGPNAFGGKKDIISDWMSEIVKNRNFKDLKNGVSLHKQDKTALKK